MNNSADTSLGNRDALCLSAMHTSLEEPTGRKKQKMQWCSCQRLSSACPPKLSLECIRIQRCFKWPVTENRRMTRIPTRMPSTRICTRRPWSYAFAVILFLFQDVDSSLHPVIPSLRSMDTVHPKSWTCSIRFWFKWEPGFIYLRFQGIDNGGKKLYWALIGSKSHRSDSNHMWDNHMPRYPMLTVTLLFHHLQVSICIYSLPVLEAP